MPLRIGWSVAITIPSGPKLSLSRSVEVDAYDSIKVDVAKDAKDLSVELQPGGAGKVKFLAIAATRYTDLSFKVNTTGSSALKVTLDQPQILVGDGAIELLTSSPKKLFFTNGSPTEDVSIEILVGRIS